MPRSILLVAQVSPPSPLSAARRVAGLSKYLSRLGHRVTVLTSAVSGSGPIDGAAHVVRTRDLLVSRLNWRRQNFASLTEGGGSYAAAPSPITAWLVPGVETVSWLPFALPRAAGLVRQQRVDCVITTAPPFAGHLVGLALHARGVPWVADFRDGWRFESERLEFATPLHDWFDRQLERSVATAADVVTAVTDPIATDLRDRLGARAVTITNGFDPDDRPSAVDGSPLVSPERHTLVHTGRMAYGGRSPRQVLDAVRGAPDLRDRVELLFAGPLTDEERELIEAEDTPGTARAVGSLPRERTIQLQHASDSLLLLTGGGRSVATQKIFEYLAARKPILVLGEHTEAARIVRAANAGLVAPVDDTERIATALRELVAGNWAPPHPSTVDRFAYPALATQMAEQVERAINRARRATAGSPPHGQDPPDHPPVAP